MRTRIPADAIRSERGSMLVLTLLVLLGLTSVGMIAVQKVNSELRYAGNSRKGAVAYRVTEGGAFTALAYTQAIGPAAFAAQVQGDVNVDDDEEDAGDGTAGTEWGPEDMVAAGVAYFDLSATGSFGYEGSVEDPGVGGGQAPFAFDVAVTPTGMRQPLVGYSASGPSARCRFKYQFDTRGRVGIDRGNLDASSSVWQQIRTLQFIGPLPCEQAVQGTVPDA